MAMAVSPSIADTALDRTALQMHNRYFVGLSCAVRTGIGLQV